MGKINKWFDLIGLASNTTSHIEKLVSGLGGVIGIIAVWKVSSLFLTGYDTPLMVASMGASAVLLFAVPHGQLSQPWNLCAGHILSAIVGVSCAVVIPDQVLAAGLAVGLAIIVMHYTQSIHPPGGATALMAVIGGPSIHQLGFAYVLTPVLLNTLVILTIAIIFNLPFAWRRYPEGLMPSKKACGQTRLQHADLKYALEEMNAVSYINEHELAQLFSLAEKHAADDHLPVNAIHTGHFYSNGLLGAEWSVRHLIDGPDDPTREYDQIIYKVVAGDHQYSIGSAKRKEIATWARYEVTPDETRPHGWRRIAADE